MLIWCFNRGVLFAGVSRICSCWSSLFGVACVRSLGFFKSVLIVLAGGLLHRLHLTNVARVLMVAFSLAFRQHDLRVDTRGFLR